MAFLYFLGMNVGILIIIFIILHKILLYCVYYIWVCIMNQILVTELKPRNSRQQKLKKILKLQFYFSIIFIIILSSIITYKTVSLYKKEKYSSQILNNYNITKLYSDIPSGKLSNFNENVENSHIIGIIEIPKINVYYPVFTTYDDELLKISPCKFYGPQPGKIGNLCIAGHNYDNGKFFSNIIHLTENDEIIITNNSNKKFSYFVFDIYEVKSDDLSPVYSYNKNLKLLTLITCNNLNNNRIIVKAYKK